MRGACCFHRHLKLRLSRSHPSCTYRARIPSCTYPSARVCPLTQLYGPLILTPVGPEELELPADAAAMTPLGQPAAPRAFRYSASTAVGGSSSLEMKKAATEA